MDPTPGRPWWRRDAALALAIAVAVIVTYARTWHAGFIWDDDSHVTANHAIVGGGGLAEVWTSASANYFPLTTTTFWALHRTWGLNPLPYHLADVLLQAGSAILLWLVLRRLRVPGAWLGAALWALHPVQVDSAAWISELKNTQASLFFLLACWFFLRWLEPAATSRRPGYYAAMVVCAALAILSKASTVMLPVALLLARCWQTRTWRWRYPLQLAPLFGLSAAAAGWTIWEQKYHSMALGADWNFTGLARAVIAGKAIWFYLGKLLWPEPLMFVYPRWTIHADGLALLPLIAAAAALVLLWRGRQRFPGALFAAGYFVALLFPVLGFFNVYYFRYSFVADHFQHLASMGPLAFLGAALARGSERWQVRSHRFAAVVPGLVLLTLAALTWRETGTYRESPTLWRVTYARNPSAWIAATILGMEATDAGRLDEALRLQDAAMRVKADAFEVHYNRGLALKKLGRLDEAMAHYRRALELKPDFSEAEHNLGIALVTAGQSNEAIPHFEQALRLKKDEPATHLHLGIALSVTGRLKDAIPHFNDALRLNPTSAETEYALARTLQADERGGEAVPHYEAALKLKPDWADAHYYLAMALRGLGRTNESAEHLATARRLRPELPPLP